MRTRRRHRQGLQERRPDDALDYVLGYTCANDVSARDWQIKRGGSQWSRGKTFDTFAPLGPALVTPEDIPDPNALRIQTRLNGEVVQDSNTSDMIFNVREIIAFLSGSTTLLPGTVILTGTPQGVGMARTPPRWLVPGDEVTIEIEKIGALTNPRRARAGLNRNAGFQAALGLHRSQDPAATSSGSCVEHSAFGVLRSSCFPSKS